MPTIQKKAPQKRSSLRDLAAKKSLDDSFTVHRLPAATHAEDDDFSGENGGENNVSAETAESHVENENHLFRESTPGDSAEELMPDDAMKEAKDFVKVNFAKFVQLVASHDFAEVLKNNGQEEVIISSNLLAELAGAHDGREGKKVPIVFLIGLAIGVVLTYFLLTK